MGVWDFLKKKRGSPEQGSASGLMATAHGWDAIEAAFAELYPGQQPRHWKHGGVMRVDDLRSPPENPFDGVSIYDAVSFWHYVSFGLTDLYDHEPNDEWSGFGFEFTFRVAKTADPEPSLWPIDVMGSLARAVFQGAEFASGHSVKMGPIAGPRVQTTLTALLLAKDPGLEKVRETAHGKLSFLLILGVDGSVRERALELGGARVLADIREQNPTLVTRL